MHSPLEMSKLTVLTSLADADEEEGDSNGVLSGSLLLTFLSRFSKNPDESCLPMAGVNQTCCKQF